MLDLNIIILLGRLSVLENRRAAAKSLALTLGGTDLLIFSRDPDVGIALPVLGFPQTFQAASDWQKFLSRCTPGKVTRAQLPFPGAQETTLVSGYATVDGMILVLQGADLKIDRAFAIGSILPLLNAGFLAEWKALRAKSLATTMQASAESSRLLAEQLDKTRRDLETSLLDSLRERKYADLLAEAGKRLSNTTDARVMFNELARLVTPAVADWCIIDLRDEAANGRFERVSLICKDPSEIPIAGASIPMPDSRLNEDASIPFGLVDAQVFRFSIHSGDAGTFAVLTAVLRSTDSERIAEHGRVLEQLSKRATLSYRSIALYGQLRNAVQLRDEFLAIASHELKTPLTTLTLELQFLTRYLSRQNGTSDTALITDAISTASAQATALSTLIGTLLDVTRISNGQLVIEKDKVDLSMLAKQVANRFLQSAKNNSQIIRVHAPHPLYLECDRVRIEQVFTNLLSNAVKYGENKPIDVFVRTRNSTVPRHAEIIIADQGMGIHRRDRRRIFGRFERAITYQNVSGLGLGLYITRQIIEAHEGSVRLSSRPGIGSTFRIKLPGVLGSHSRVSASHHKENAPCLSPIMSF